jgi:hypothetical protein
MSAQPTGGKRSEVLWWLAVLPAALLASMAVRLLLGVGVQAARSGGWEIFGDSGVGYWPKMFLFYVPQPAAFVLAGALVAPRYKRATAIVLATLGILGSLLIHIAGQHLVGNKVGHINYTHFLFESAGFSVAAVGLCLRHWQKRSVTTQ